MFRAVPRLGFITDTVATEIIQNALDNGPFILSHCVASKNRDGLLALRPCRTTKLETAGQIFVFLAFPTISYFTARFASLEHNPAGSVRTDGEIAAAALLAVCMAILTAARFANSRFTFGKADYLVYKNHGVVRNVISFPVLRWRIDECDKIVVYQGRAFCDGSSTSMRTRLHVAFKESFYGQGAPMFVWG